ncbi:MAG: hypothetical protein EA370_12040 [Wenzhouxiangella sp.]|nr:MAG: hypothetical protein EA370_12040 [Wenzhouxiangella sp.]
MSTITDVDLLILGGGCAGLSLAMRLAQSAYAGRVAILEPRQQYLDDRSWCFWDRNDHQQSGLVSKRWRRWSFSRMNRSVRDCTADSYSYQYVSSRDFYKRALELIQSSSRITLLRGETALAVESGDGQLVVTTQTRKLRACQIVDTRPPSANRLGRALLHQCFLGRVVRLAPDSPGAFDPLSVELMTDMKTDGHGLQFSYVLPFSPHRALVEVTRFAPSPVPSARLERELETLLQRRGWQVESVERSESAILPMGLPLAEDSLPAGMVRAGTGGGALRAASGYGFQRIQRWADACCASLEQGGPALGQPPESSRQRFMDQLFLRVLRDQPQLGPTLFEQMADRVPGQVFVRFMSDQASWTDCVRVVASLPAYPFLRSLLYRPRHNSTRLATP